MPKPIRNIILGVVAGLLLAPGALAQPEPAPAGDGERAPGNQAEMRRRLERRKAELRREEERVDRALDALNRGDSPEEIMQHPRGPEADPPEPGDPGPVSNEHPRERRAGRRGNVGVERPERPRNDRDRPDGPSRERLDAVLRERMPDLAQRLDRLREENPEMAGRLAARLGPRVMEIENIREDDPGLADLKLDELRNSIAIVESLGALRAGREDPEKLNRARAELAQRVADQFDIRARLHRHEIEQLRGRVERLQADLDQKLSQRDEAIRRRLDEMLSGKGRMDLFGDERPASGHGPGRPGPRPARDGPDRGEAPPEPRPDRPPPR